MTTRLAILTSFNLDLIARPAARAFESAGLAVEIHLGAYGQWQSEILDPGSSLYRFAPTMTVLFLEAEDLLPSLSPDGSTCTIVDAEQRALEAWRRVESAIATLLDRQSGSVVCHTLVAPPSNGLGLLEGNNGYSHTAAIDAFNRALRVYAASEPRLEVFNYNALVLEHGYARWHDARLWHLGRMRLANVSVSTLATAYASYLVARSTPRRKCLVLDLDNTLWGGVLGEDGVGGIQIGHQGLGLAFREFQMAVLSLYRRGVILAIASKNDVADAVGALRNHPDMVLRPEHFAAMEIHWNDKSESVKRIAERLNIGIDSLVFWDDNPLERGMVRSQVPEVLVPEVPADPSEYVRFLRNLGCFDTLSLTSEDRARGRMYREQAERDSFLQQSTQGVQTLDAYYASLEMVVHVEGAREISVPRIAQLTQRTNQFNLTSRRYTEAEIQARLANPEWRIYTLSLRDRFGDLGLIGAAMMRAGSSAWELDTFLMSCRALGRRVEETFATHLVSVAAAMGKPLRGVFIPTKKTAPIRELLERHHWLLDEAPNNDGEQRIEMTNLPIPTWLQLIVT